MDIPLLGSVTKDTELEWYTSEPLPVPVLGGKLCRFLVAGYDEDPNKEDFHIAIANFLAIEPSVLKAAENDIYQYYQDANPAYEDEESEEIGSASEVWKQVELGSEAMVSRRAYGDHGIYISLGGSCDWEEEHGLEIVFKNGLKVNKIGPYDSHLTNSDAFADESLEDVVYCRVGSPDEE